MPRKFMKVSLATFATCLCAYAASSPAATQTATFTVSASVQASCSLSTTNLDFGSYSANSSTDYTTTSKVSATCSNGSSYSVALSYPGAGVGARAMASGGNALTYQLYKDSGRTSVWGDGASSLTATGSGSSVDHTVYGLLPKGQFVPTGSYTDTVTATVTF